MKKLRIKNIFIYFFILISVSVLPACKDAAISSGSTSLDEQPASDMVEEYIRSSDIVLDLSAETFAPLTQEQIASNPCPDLSVPTYITDRKSVV